MHNKSTNPIIVFIASIFFSFIYYLFWFNYNLKELKNEYPEFNSKSENTLSWVKINIGLFVFIAIIFTYSVIVYSETIRTVIFVVFVISLLVSAIVAIKFTSILRPILIKENHSARSVAIFIIIFFAGLSALLLTPLHLFNSMTYLTSLGNLLIAIYFTFLQTKVNRLYNSERVVLQTKIEVK